MNQVLRILMIVILSAMSLPTEAAKKYKVDLELSLEKSLANADMEEVMMIINLEKQRKEYYIK